MARTSFSKRGIPGRLKVTHPFRQHIPGSDHGDGCHSCEVASYQEGDMYTGSAPANPRERGWLTGDVPEEEEPEEVSDYGVA